MNKRSNPIRTYKYLIAACLASLIASTFASYFFYNRWSEAEDRSARITNEKNVVSENYSTLKKSYDKNFNDLLMIRDENATVFTLLAADSTKRYIARVYWNHYTRETFIDVLSLPLPDSAMQYQLWAIAGGLTADAGVFNADPELGVQHLKPVVNAEKWSVTMEPTGGSVQPTPDRVCLLSVR